MSISTNKLMSSCIAVFAMWLLPAFSTFAEAPLEANYTSDNSTDGLGQSAAVLPASPPSLPEPMLMLGTPTGHNGAGAIYFYNIPQASGVPQLRGVLQGPAGATIGHGLAYLEDPSNPGLFVDLSGLQSGGNATPKLAFIPRSVLISNIINAGSTSANPVLYSHLPLANGSSSSGVVELNAPAGATSGYGRHGLELSVDTDPSKTVLWTTDAAHSAGSGALIAYQAANFAASTSSPYTPATSGCSIISGSSACSFVQTGATGSQTGFGLAAASNKVAVGSPQGFFGYGEVNVFNRGANGFDMTAPSPIYSSVPALSSYFGQSIDIEDNIALVGAPLAANPYCPPSSSCSNNGLAEVFRDGGFGYTTDHLIPWFGNESLSATSVALITALDPNNVKQYMAGVGSPNPSTPTHHGVGHYTTYFVGDQNGPAANVQVDHQSRSWPVMREMGNATHILPFDMNGDGHVGNDHVISHSPVVLPYGSTLPHPDNLMFPTTGFVQQYSNTSHDQNAVANILSSIYPGEVFNWQNPGTQLPPLGAFNVTMSTPAIGSDLIVEVQATNHTDAFIVLMFGGPTSRTCSTGLVCAHSNSGPGTPIFPNQIAFDVAVRVYDPAWTDPTHPSFPAQPNIIPCPIPGPDKACMIVANGSTITAGFQGFELEYYAISADFIPLIDAVTGLPVIDPITNLPVKVFERIERTEGHKLTIGTCPTGQTCP